jgi:hypothetical protein
MASWIYPVGNKVYQIELKLDISKSKKIIENPLYLSSKICHIPMRPLGKVSQECESYIKDNLK